MFLLSRVDLLTLLDVVTYDACHVTKSLVPWGAKRCTRVVFVQNSAEVSRRAENSSHVKNVGFVFTAANAFENAYI